MNIKENQTIEEQRPPSKMLTDSMTPSVAKENMQSKMIDCTVVAPEARAGGQLRGGVISLGHSNPGDIAPT